MARQLIENLTAEWDPDEFTDEYREAMLKIVEAKINGEEIEVVEAEPTAKVVDLMEALKASVAAAKKQADDEPRARRQEVSTNCGQEGDREEVHRQEDHGEEVDREEDDGPQEGRRGVTFPAPYRARPARRDDLDALVALFEARDRVDVGFVDPSRDEIVADWASPFVELERDTVVVEAPDGIACRVRARARRWILPCSSSRSAGCIPITPAVGSARRSCWAGRAARRASRRRESSAPFRMVMPSTDEAALALFSGVATPRPFVLAHASGRCPPTISPVDDPDGITIRPGRRERDEIDRVPVLEEAFRDHFGYEPSDSRSGSMSSGASRIRPWADRRSRSTG